MTTQALSRERLAELAAFKPNGVDVAESLRNPHQETLISSGATGLLPPVDEKSCNEN